MSVGIPRADAVIDASNVTSGGVLGHLRGLLAHARLAPFDRILVIGGADQAADFADLAPGVTFHADPSLPLCKWRRGGTLGYLRTVARINRWRDQALPARAAAASARVLIAANGILPAAPPPGIRTVAISHNMLPFAPGEWRALGFGLQRLRITALRRSQTRSFHRADGIIFLSEHARQAISAAAGLAAERPRTTVAYLGIDAAVFHPPAVARPDPGAPIDVLYVSSLDRYKHHREAVRAIGQLRRETGRDMRLHLAGWEDRLSARRLVRVIAAEGLAGAVIRHGFVPQERLAHLYRTADLFLFASTCENCPTILIEAMASGLPIACTNAAPMTEIAGAAAIGFDARDPGSIAAALKRLIAEPPLRQALADEALARARAFTPERHARQAWGFIGNIAAMTRP